MNALYLTESIQIDWLQMLDEYQEEKDKSYSYGIKL